MRGGNNLREIKKQKVTEAEGLVLALFAKQKTPRLKENVKEATTESSGLRPQLLFGT